MSKPEGEKNQCAVATDAAMEVAMDECSSTDLLTNISRMIGLSESPDPDDLPDELSKPDCMDMDIVREWIAVRAFELVNDGEGLSMAIEQAWAEAGDSCGW
jgi:hypothetical protein